MPPRANGSSSRKPTWTIAPDALRSLPIALWATALYAGLRRGEPLALRSEDVDLAAGVIRVDRAYDPKAAVFVAPKSRAGVRRVPIPSVLREYLIAHRRSGARPGSRSARQRTRRSTTGRR